MQTEFETPNSVCDSPSEQSSPPVVPTVPKHVFDELLAAAARVNEHYLAQRPTNS